MRVTFLIICFFLVRIINAQYVEKMVFNNFGQANQNANFSFESSFGENVVGYDLGLVFSGFILPDSTNQMFDVQEIIKIDEIKIFPNPTSGGFSMLTERDLKALEIYDSRGVLVRKEIDIMSKQLFFNTYLSPGVYHIIIYYNDNKGSCQKRIIIY